MEKDEMNLEFEDLAAIARQKGISLGEVRKMVEALI